MSANPGSSEARRLGCTCPVIDNAFGKGSVINGEIDERNFYTDPDCPIHQDMRGLDVNSGGARTNDRTITEEVDDSRDSSVPSDPRDMAGIQGRDLDDVEREAERDRAYRDGGDIQT